mgnify:CR=1 FL=1
MKHEIDLDRSHHDLEEKQPLTGNEWKRVWALIALCGLNIVFWAVYEQQGNTLQLWADQQTAWPTVLGFTIPSTWYQSFNPFMIFVFVPLLNALWARQAVRGTEPSSLSKLAIASGATMGNMDEQFGQLDGVLGVG